MMADRSALTDDPLKDFVALSSILTGISTALLHPPLDTFGTAAAYLDWIAGRSPKVVSAFDALMTLYAANRQEPPAVMGRLIFGGDGGPPRADLAFVARAVMLMWYLGAWYEPDALQAFAADPQPFGPDCVIVSSDAYTQGWAWRVAQAHPMGYSDLRFGYWQGPPQPLHDFLGT